MAFTLNNAPVDAISPENGPPIATGGTMQGTGTHTVNSTPVPVSGGVVYALTAPVSAGGSAALHWEIELTADGETWVERDGYGPDGEQSGVDEVSGEGVSVRVWTPAIDATAEFRVVIDGTATVAEPTVAPRTGRIILTVPGDILAENIMASGGLIAGSPGAARVVINADGVVAFDSSGVETAQITGEGGEFVGGEFRTSDNLPGQVTLSDDAYVDSSNGDRRPGISVIPVDASSMATPPGIGASGDAILFNGGRNLAGGRAHLAMSPGGIYGEARLGSGQVSSVSVAVGETRLRSNGPNGDYGWVLALPGQAELAYVATDNTYFSRIKADDTEAYLYTRAGGAERYLSIDADGVWVKTNKSGSWRSYNLEETAQDSGWQTFGLEAGVTGSQALAWRNKNGVIYFRGFVTGDWTTGVWNTIASGLNPDWLPSATWVVAEAGGATKGATLQMTADGRLRVSPPVTSTTSYYLNAMTYPAG